MASLALAGKPQSTLLVFQETPEMKARRGAYCRTHQVWASDSLRGERQDLGKYPEMWSS